MCPNRMAMQYLKKCKYVYHKYGLKHFVLLFFYIWYIILGGVMFYAFEHDNVRYLDLLWQITLNAERSTFIRSDLLPLMFNNTNFLKYLSYEQTLEATSILERQLSSYERRLGVEFRLAGPYTYWEFDHALLYSVSLCTTIGFGYVHPLTNGGRVASLFYSLCGIPFTMVLVKDWSRLAARILNYPGTLLLKCWDAFRFCTLKNVKDVEELKALRRRGRVMSNDVVLNIPISVALFALMGWLVAGAFAFCAWETSWTVLESIAFCFNTLTTIGQTADTVPHYPRILLGMLVYIYAGLAVVSLFIDLIYAKLLLAYRPDFFVNDLNKGRMGYTDDEVSSRPSTRSSFDNESVVGREVDKDVDLGSCVTLGILRMDGRARRQEAVSLRNASATHSVSRGAQTQLSVPAKRTVQMATVTISENGSTSYQHVVLAGAGDQRSDDDVARLLVEPYE